MKKKLVFLLLKLNFSPSKLNAPQAFGLNCPAEKCTKKSLIYCAKSLMKPKKNWDSIMVSLCLVQGHCQGQLFCGEKAKRKNVC